MANKLTAVDFLKDKFIMIQWLLVRDEISKKQADGFLNKWYDRAKQMEQEQLSNAKSESYKEAMKDVCDYMMKNLSYKYNG